LHNVRIRDRVPGTDDARWQCGSPPKHKPNFSWLQNLLSHHAPSGTAGFVLANGRISSNQSGEGEIRRKIIEADLVDCMVALPGQLFYTTQIPVCLWFLTRDKGNANKGNGQRRSRPGETLFIDARKLGTLTDRVHRELPPEDLARIAGTYHAWRGDPDSGTYTNQPGFSKSATLAEIAFNGFVLTPGRYVGAEEAEDDGEPFEQKMARLVAELESQFAESAKLETAIRENLKGLGYGG
ncbi:N-6 DNA methylase, partial [Nostoc sp. NIES-2111]